MFQFNKLFGGCNSTGAHNDKFVRIPEMCDLPADIFDLSPGQLVCFAGKGIGPNLK
jgi:hypothetical protein